MKILFSSSELDRQRRDWHHALIQTEKGDKPYLIADERCYRTMRPGAYMIQTQRNRNNAPITYIWISDDGAKKIVDLVNVDKVAAEELMARLGA